MHACMRMHGPAGPYAAHLHTHILMQLATGHVPAVMYIPCFSTDVGLVFLHIAHAPVHAWQLPDWHLVPDDDDGRRYPPPEPDDPQASYVVPS
jgi:hypothetical protein